REKLNMEMLGLRRATGKTMLFVTHSIPEAVLMGDRVVVLSQRPATVLREVVVGLGHDRALHDQDSPEFTCLTAAVRESLSAAGSSAESYAGGEWPASAESRAGSYADGEFYADGEMRASAEPRAGFYTNGDQRAEGDFRAVSGWGGGS
ncbi:MAG: hypothetical protein ACHQ7M_07745, partial [Chloroflexota bacterium]